MDKPVWQVYPWSVNNRCSVSKTPLGHHSPCGEQSSRHPGLSPCPGHSYYEHSVSLRQYLTWLPCLFSNLAPGFHASFLHFFLFMTGFCSRNFTVNTPLLEFITFVLTIILISTLYFIYLCSNLLIFLSTSYLGAQLFFFFSGSLLCNVKMLFSDHPSSLCVYGCRHSSVQFPRSHRCWCAVFSFTSRYLSISFEISLLTIFSF